MSSGGSAPAAPDYTGAAQATAAGNLQNLDAQTVANRPNQTTPWGTSTWTQGTPDASGNSQWSQQITLTPAEQSALNDQQAIQSNQSNLAQTLQGQVASTMAGGFNAPSLSSYLSGVNGVSQNFGGFSPSGVNSVNQAGFNPSAFTRGTQPINQNAQGAVSRAGTANLNAPQFSDANAQAGAQAAYNAQVGLLQPQMAQDTTNLDSQLRLQGLTPGTEAYNNAAQNLSRTQAQTLTQAANQAVQTGNNEANANYASALAGYNSGNSAQNQAYSQDANTFNLGNAASTQSLNNGLSLYNAQLQGQSAQNTAQGQAYTQALAGYGANQSAQAASNAAQGQAYSQGLQGYGAAYQSAMNNYLQPLNSMNAVLSGQQVTSPSMPSFATAGYTPGADMTGAATAQGNYNQSVYNANQASASSTNGAIAGLGSAAIMALAMY